MHKLGEDDGTPNNTPPPHLLLLPPSVDPPSPTKLETDTQQRQQSLQRQGTYNAFAADVWAAGVCLWVFRFGTPPFYDPDPANLFLEICRQPLLFPTAVDEGDEEVIRQEAKEARRRARRAAAAKVGGCGRTLCFGFFHGLCQNFVNLPTRTEFSSSSSSSIWG